MNDRPQTTLNVVNILLTCLLLPGIAAAAAIVEGSLPRSAQTGFSAGMDADGLFVADVDEDSPASASGLIAGDRLVAINGLPVQNMFSGLDWLEKHPGDAPLTLTLRRDGETLTAAYTPTPRPLEQIDGVDSYYGEVRVGDGSTLRTIVSLPEYSDGPLPAMLFTQWVSCDSIELLDQSTSSLIQAELMRRSGFAFVRVERSASGDSRGPACHELDYDTEIAHYVEAFDQLLSTDPRLDTEEIVILGSSLGSTTAPLVALGLEQLGWDVDGVAVGGGGALTYLERMINFDRWYLERRPDAVSPAEINPSMNNRIRFHYEYLVEQRHPDSVAQDSAAMAAVRADIRGMEYGAHYGRPYSYHQQAAQANFLAAWTELDAKVWVVFGEFDQFEAEHGHRVIVDMVNRVRPGAATWVFLPSVDHGYWAFPSAEAAYSWEQGARVMALYVEPLLSWLAVVLD